MKATIYFDTFYYGEFSGTLKSNVYADTREELERLISIEKQEVLKDTLVGDFGLPYKSTQFDKVVYSE